MIELNIEEYIQLNEYTEKKLDEADEFAKSRKERLTHDEVFKNMRNKISKWWEFVLNSFILYLEKEILKMLEENETYCQEYFIHMNNGDVLRICDLEWEKGIIYGFEESQKDFLYINAD